MRLWAVCPTLLDRMERRRLLGLAPWSIRASAFPGVLTEFRLSFGSVSALFSLPEGTATAQFQLLARSSLQSSFRRCRPPGPFALAPKSFPCHTAGIAGHGGFRSSVSVGASKPSVTISKSSVSSRRNRGQSQSMATLSQSVATLSTVTVSMVPFYTVTANWP